MSPETKAKSKPKPKEKPKANKATKSTKPAKSTKKATAKKTETTKKTGKPKSQTTKVVKKSKKEDKTKQVKSKESRQKRKTISKSTKKTKGSKKEDKIKSKEAKKMKDESVKKSRKFIAGIKEVNLYSMSGKSTGKVKLPIAFDEIYRLDLIRRAVKASRANQRQPYAPSPLSGMQHSTRTWGKGRGAARVQRLVDGRRAVESPNNVGGRRAHPPTVQKIWAEKINKKEKQKARRAALAAITDPEIVSKRGHKFDNKVTLPIIIEDEFENVIKIKNTIEIFQKIGVYDDVVRAQNGKHIRAGRGKTRGRIYRRPKSILIVAINKEGISKGVGNFVGVDVVTPDVLSVEDLAPGGDPGRLTIITESALKLMGNW
jgi:large subunit ribosomal protein L4e